MERSMAIAVGILVAVLAGTLGLAYAYLWFSSDPATAARRMCGARPGGPACSDFRITSRTLNRVEFTYNQSDGTHCAGYQEITRRGPLGLPAGGGGGSTCVPSGQTIPPRKPPPPTPLADGNLPCQGNLVFGSATATSSGFQIAFNNGSASTCDVSGPAKLLFWDSAGRPLAVDVQPSAEAGSPVALAPGASGVLAFDNGSGPCQSPPRMLVITSSGASGQMAAPASVCGPITSHPARRAP